MAIIYGTAFGFRAINHFIYTFQCFFVTIDAQFDFLFWVFVLILQFIIDFSFICFYFIDMQSYKFKKSAVAKTVKEPENDLFKKQTRSEKIVSSPLCSNCENLKPQNLFGLNFIK